MDDLNRRMMEQKRAQARALQARLVAQRQGTEPVAGAPSGHGVLELWSRGDQHRYTLLDHVVRPGDELDLHVGATTGWLRGRFAWDGRPEQRPVLLVTIHDPDGLDALGEATVTVPEHGRCRWVRAPQGERG